MASLPIDQDILWRLFGDDVRAGVIKDPMDVSDAWKNSYSENTTQKIWAAKYTARHPNLVALELSSFKCGHDAPIYTAVEETVTKSGTPYFSFKDIDENKPTGSIKIRVETISYFLKRYREDMVRNKQKQAEVDAKMREFEAKLRAEIDGRAARPSAGRPTKSRRPSASTPFGGRDNSREGCESRVPLPSFDREFACAFLHGDFFQPTPFSASYSQPAGPQPQGVKRPALNCPATQSMLGLSIRCSGGNMELTAVFKKVPEGYIAWVEELPGANTQGRTLEETRENLQEAIRLVFEANRELTGRDLQDEEVLKESVSVAAL